MTWGSVSDTLGRSQASWLNTESLCSAAWKKGRDVTEYVMKSWCCGVSAVVFKYRTDLQQLVDESLLVHHVGHIWHIQALKLWAVLQHNVSNLRYQHALSQSSFQIHKKSRRDRQQLSIDTNKRLRLRFWYVELSLFTGCHHTANVGKQNVMLHLSQGLLQCLWRIEMIDSNSEAPQVRRFRADQLKHRLQREETREQELRVPSRAFKTVKKLSWWFVAYSQQILWKIKTECTPLTRIACVFKAHSFLP